MAVACAARCPDAVLSGSVRSFTEPDVPDPRPGLLLDGRAHPLAGIAGHHGAGSLVTVGLDHTLTWRRPAGS